MEYACLIMTIRPASLAKTDFSTPTSGEQIGEILHYGHKSRLYAGTSEKSVIADDSSSSIFVVIYN